MHLNNMVITANQTEFVQICARKFYLHANSNVMNFADQNHKLTNFDHSLNVQRIPNRVLHRFS
jgi:hypothetical protein